MLYRSMKEMERLEKERKSTTIGYLIVTLLLVITAGACAFFGNTSLAVVVLVSAVLMIPVYLVMMITHK